MTKLSKDLSTLTSISEDVFTRLCTKSNYCIAEAVHESQLNCDVLTSIDIGIGILDIKLDVNEFKYRFTPSKELKLYLNRVKNNSTSQLSTEIDKVLINKT